MRGDFTIFGKIYRPGISILLNFSLPHRHVLIILIHFCCLAFRSKKQRNNCGNFETNECWGLNLWFLLRFLWIWITLSHNLWRLTCVRPVVSYASAPDGPNLGKFSLWRRIDGDLSNVELIQIAQIIARPNSYNILEVPIFKK